MVWVMLLRLYEMGGTKLAVPEERSSTTPLNTSGDPWCMKVRYFFAKARGLLTLCLSLINHPLRVYNISIRGLLLVRVSSSIPAIFWSFMYEARYSHPLSHYRSLPCRQILPPLSFFRSYTTIPLSSQTAKTRPPKKQHALSVLDNSVSHHPTTTTSTTSSNDQGDRSDSSQRLREFIELVLQRQIELKKRMWLMGMRYIFSM